MRFRTNFLEKEAVFALKNKNNKRNPLRTVADQMIDEMFVAALLSGQLLNSL